MVVINSTSVSTMTARVSVILSVVLLGLASGEKVAKSGQCVDNTLYEKYVCRDKPDGTSLLVPGSCSQYYRCSRGQTTKLSCPNFYDPASKQCVCESNCVEVDNTDCVIPTPPPCSSGCTTPSPGPCGNWFDPNDLYGSFVCRGKADGTMLIVPQSCNDYYYCIGGHSYRKTCGRTRYFNPKVNACDEPSNVNCRSG